MLPDGVQRQLTSRRCWVSSSAQAKWLSACWTMSGRRPSSRSCGPSSSLEPSSTRTSTTSTVASPNGAMVTRRFAILMGSTQGTKMATVSAKCMSTRLKGSGRYCVRGCARTGGFPKTSCRCIWAFLSSSITPA